IYVNGMSNGGGMTHILACELSERIAAVGLVAGAYTYPWEACQPERPVPAIVFHGDADRIVPIAGGPIPRASQTLPDIREWVATLAQRNGCVEAPRELAPQGSVRGEAYTRCAADVVFYTVVGGGHTWPGGEGIPAWIGGVTTDDVDATALMWEFFAAHPLE
ncbi:MAG: hypothetical protein GX558_00710, partial [Clostridiales bacterium]|nr:hypothetical protein [Clostridiales bacterium]